MLMEELGTVLPKLIAITPLLYLGMFMILDPAGLLSILKLAQAGIRNFHYRLRGLHWHVQQDLEPAAVSRVVGVGMRVFGVMLLACALVPVIT